MSDEKKRDPPSRALNRARAALDRGREKLAAEPVAAGARDETDGPDGPDPTRYGDWERKGRCIDF